MSRLASFIRKYGLSKGTHMYTERQRRAAFARWGVDYPLPASAR